MPVKKYLPHFFLLLSIIIGAFFRFYKLNWGQNYFFHPDEYHIVGAVERLNAEGLFSNPKLFSYGSFTVYLIYIFQGIYEFLSGTSSNVFLVGRFLSALFSTLTLVNIYLISKCVFKKSNYFQILTVLTASFVPGLIQQAHYLTPETFMTFWITLSVYFLVVYHQKNGLKNLLIAAAFMGIAAGTKISALAAAPIILPAVFLMKIKQSGVAISVQRTLLYLFTVLIFFYAVFPYAVLDYKNFISTTRYETSLSTGAIKVFYTRSFENTFPLVFQLSKIYPQTLGFPLTVLSFLGLGFVSYRLFGRGLKLRKTYLILIGVFLSYFVFNSFLFTKWTRFVHPTIPFLIIITFIGINELQNTIKHPFVKKVMLYILLLLLVVPTILRGLSYLYIYKRNDVRISATNWVKNNIPQKSVILTETGNTLEVPLSGNYFVIPFDFYNVDVNPVLYKKLLTDLQKSDYFIIQSRRIFANHNDAKKYPVINNFYKNLQSGRLGFEKIKTFSSFPTLKIGEIKLEIYDENAEETWTVFDHPVIRIYKKNSSYTLNQYDELLR